MLDKKRLKVYDLLVLKLKYYKAQLDTDREIFEEAQEEFAKAYQEVCKTVPEHERKVLEGSFKPKKKKEEKQNQQEEQEREEIEKKPENPGAKKIYRAIAIKAHPDKLVGSTEEEIEEKDTLFREAQKAMETDDMVELIKIAEDLDIEPPAPDEDQIQAFEKNISEIQKEQKMLKETTAWRWHQEADEPTKEDILIRYMQYIYTTFK